MNVRVLARSCTGMEQIKDNLSGCRKCFCFGVTSECQSAG